ncbi:MAG: TetR/AcrR family transcriptional regulator [Burkholderiales bacterium]
MASKIAPLRAADIRKAPRKELTRAQKVEKTRRDLIDAAVRIVGKLGYEGASIANITTQAKVAQGTFYNYFKSRQDILDQLLPMMGDEMTQYIRVRMNPDARGAAREKQRIELYFDFLFNHPWYHRLVNEAETMAPKAHKVYFKKISEGYIRSLTRMVERGEIKCLTLQQLEPIVYILLSTRTYLAQRYVFSKKGAVSKVPAEVVDTYVQFVSRALFN